MTILPLLRAVFDSREMSVPQHIPLRSLLDELGRLLFPMPPSP